MKIDALRNVFVFAMLVCFSTLEVSGNLLIQNSDTPTASQQEQDPKENDSATKDSGAKSESKPEEKEPEPFSVNVAGDSIVFTAPGVWKKATPKSSMIEAEIKIVKLDDDKEDGRLTIMGAGGTIEANITRWQGQFVEEDGSPVEVKKEEKTISDCKVTTVDIQGTYIDSPSGPFAGGAKVERPNYRMLAAIVQTKTRGNYFVKFYGPKNTVEKNAEAFKEMIDSLKVTEKEKE